MCLFPVCRQSPLNLVQERYNDPWQHIVCCLLCRCISCLQVQICFCWANYRISTILWVRYHHPLTNLSLLCSRTSGSEGVRCTISFFLYHCQCASYILVADDEELQDLIEPLGLQETRIRAVKQMTLAFFEKVLFHRGLVKCCK